MSEWHFADEHLPRDDVAGLSEFYGALPPESTRRRFLSCGSRSVRDLGLAFAERDGEGFVGILDEPGANDGAVVAHASVQPDGRGAAEVASAVADEHQGRGIGKALMDMALQHARRLGLRRLTATLLAENTPMRQLLLGTGCATLSDRLEIGVEEITLLVVGRRRSTPDLVVVTV